MSNWSTALLHSVDRRDRKCVSIQLKKWKKKKSIISGNNEEDEEREESVSIDKRR